MAGLVFNKSIVFMQVHGYRSNNLKTTTSESARQEPLNNVLNNFKVTFNSCLVHIKQDKYFFHRTLHNTPHFTRNLYKKFP